MEPKTKLRWVKKNEKTICEKLVDNEWVEAQDLNSQLSRFFQDSDDEPSYAKATAGTPQSIGIRFKGISDNTQAGY